MKDGFLSQKYKDFEKINHVWCWDGNGEFRQFNVSNMIAGDSVTGNIMIRLEGDNKVPIEEIFSHRDREYAGKEYFYPENLKVLTYDWKTNTTCFKPIKYVMRHKCDKKVYRVWVNNVEHIDVTEDHSLMCWRSRETVRTHKKIMNGELSPIKEQKPQEMSSSLIKLKTLPRNTPEKDATGYPYEMLELFGFFIGDGSIKSSTSKASIRSEGKNINLSFGTDMEECMERLVYPLQTKGYIEKSRIYPNNYDVTVKLKEPYIFSHELVTSNGKNIPNWLFSASDEEIASFLRGYFSADGTVMIRNENPIIKVVSIDKELLVKCQTLFNYLGIATTISKSNTENSHNGVFSGTYSYHLLIKDKEKFSDKVGFIIERKQERLNLLKESDIKNKSGKFDFSLVGKSKVEEIEYSGYVYDIEVEDTHVFFANDILVHNTDSGYFRLPDFIENYSVDEIVEVADDVVKMVDEEFPDFVKLAFNCPDDRSHVITTDREIVSDKSFFASKKRYAMHVIDDEGKRVDKLKIMGLEIKKANTAKAVKNFLKHMVELVLDGAEREDIVEAKNEFKEKFYHMSIAEISEPMPTTSLKKYMDSYEMTGSMKGFPYHVRAAMYYNSLCGEKDRQIFLGEKFFVCRIKSLESEYIGLPVDVSTYPSFVDDVVIDYDAMWKKAEKKITNYMEALGWDSKSMIQQKATDLFGV